MKKFVKLIMKVIITPIFLGMIVFLAFVGTATLLYDLKKDKQDDARMDIIFLRGLPFTVKEWFTSL